MFIPYSDEAVKSRLEQMKRKTVTLSVAAIMALTPVTVMAEPAGDAGDNGAAIQNEGQQNGPENQAGALRSDPVQTQVLETENLRCTYPANVTVTAPESGGEWSVVGTSVEDVVTFTQLKEGAVEEGIYASNCTVVLDPSEEPIEIDKAQVTLDNAVLQIDEGTAKITPEGTGIQFSGDKAGIAGAGTLQTTGINAEAETFTIDGSTVELLGLSSSSYDDAVVVRTMILDNGATFRTEDGYTREQVSTYNGKTYTYPLFNVVYADKLYLRNGSVMRVDLSCNLDKMIEIARAEGSTEDDRMMALEYIAEAMGEGGEAVYADAALSVTEGSRLELSGFSGVLRCEGKVTVNGEGSVIEADNQAFFDKVCPLYSEIESGEPDLQIQYSHIQDLYDELEELMAKQGTPDYDADAVAELEAEIEALQKKYWDMVEEAYYMSAGGEREEGQLVTVGYASITDGARVSLSGFLPAWSSVEYYSSMQGAPGVYVENAEFSIIEDIPEEYQEDAFVNTIPPYTETKDWLFYSDYRFSPLAIFVNSKVRISTNADRYEIAEDYNNEGSDGIVMPKTGEAQPLR